MHVAVGIRYFQIFSLMENFCQQTHVVKVYGQQMMKISPDKIFQGKIF